VTVKGRVFVFHVHATDVHCRGSKFLRNWMDFLEENADLRYPNLADVYVDDRG
jgi:DNA polymerase alpha-associated DNA helicase A